MIRCRVSGYEVADRLVLDSDKKKGELRSVLEDGWRHRAACIDQRDQGKQSKTLTAPP